MVLIDLWVRSPVMTNRYQESAPTRCRSVSRIEPYVPGTVVPSCSGSRAMHESISRNVAETW